MILILPGIILMASWVEKKGIAPMHLKIWLHNILMNILMLESNWKNAAQAILHLPKALQHNWILYIRTHLILNRSICDIRYTESLDRNPIAYISIIKYYSVLK